MSVGVAITGGVFPFRPFFGGTGGVGDGSVGGVVSSGSFSGVGRLGLGFWEGVVGGGVAGGTGDLFNREPKIFWKTFGLEGEAGGGVEVVGGFGKGFAGAGVLAGVDLEGDGVAISAKASEEMVTRDRRRGRIFFISQRVGIRWGDCPLWENLSRARMKEERGPKSRQGRGFYD